MKFTITMKDPDGPYEGIREAAQAQLALIEGISDEERDGLLESRVEQIEKTTKKFLEWGEYIRVEFDTEAGTARVVPRN